MEKSQNFVKKKRSKIIFLNSFILTYSKKKTLWKTNKSSRHAGYIQTKVYNFIKFLRKNEKKIEGKSLNFRTKVKLFETSHSFEKQSQIFWRKISELLEKVRFLRKKSQNYIRKCMNYKK